MLKTLLVHIPSESLIRRVVDGAVSLAVARAAHLDAVSIRYETANADLAVDGGARLFSSRDACASTIDFLRECYQARRYGDRECCSVTQAA